MRILSIGKVSIKSASIHSVSLFDQLVKNCRKVMAYYLDWTLIPFLKQSMLKGALKKNSILFTMIAYQAKNDNKITFKFALGLQFIMKQKIRELPVLLVSGFKSLAPVNLLLQDPYSKSELYNYRNKSIIIDIQSYKNQNTANKIIILKHEDPNHQIASQKRSANTHWLLVKNQKRLSSHVRSIKHS